MVAAVTDALSHLRVCDLEWPAGRRGRDEDSGRVRRRGHPGRGSCDPGALGRAARASALTSTNVAGCNLGAGFNNHNVGKLGVTINLRTDEGKELLRELIAVSDVVCENFAAGVMEDRGFGYEELRRIKPDIVYVSNCGFGHTGPYRDFKTWGPIVQAVSGLTFTAGLPDAEPAGWGFSYMDHGSAFYMTVAILAAAAPPRTARARGSTSISPPCRRASRCCPQRCSTGRSTDARSRPRAATAPTSARWRRTASTRAAATTAGSPSPAGTTVRSALLAKVLDEPALTSDRFADPGQRLRVATSWTN